MSLICGRNFSVMIIISIKTSNSECVLQSSLGRMCKDIVIPNTTVFSIIITTPHAVGGEEFCDLSFENIYGLLVDKALSEGDTLQIVLKTSHPSELCDTEYYDIVLNAI